jgi:hypothetical protein
VKALLTLPDRRSVTLIDGGPPACFLLSDPLASGVLVNTPAFDAALAAALPPVKFIVYPSARGAADVAAWREATGACVVAGLGEPVPGPVDERADGTVRITGRLDFLPLAGVTRGTVALRSKGPPGIVFFGPALSQREGWPVLSPDAADWSWENRVIGALGIATLAYEFAFCDDYTQGASIAGPGAAGAVAHGLRAAVS